MTDYSLRYPSVLGPSAPAADVTNYVLGVAFTVSVSCALVNVHQWCPTVLRPTGWALWQSTGAGAGNKTKIGSNHIPTWDDVVSEDLWVTDSAFTVPIDLSAGTMYILGMLWPHTANQYPSTGNDYASDVVNGVLTGEASAQAHDGNGIFRVTNVLDICPTDTFNATNYWVDMTVRTAASDIPRRKSNFPYYRRLEHFAI